MKVIIIGRAGCKYCRLARQLAKKHSHKWNYLDLNKEKNADLNTYFELERFTTVPQIWVNGTHIGGYEEYLKLVERPSNGGD